MILIAKLSLRSLIIRKFYLLDCEHCLQYFADALLYFSCPWTGTAIGKKNMRSFQCFVALVFLCLIVDIFLLTGVPK